jgi:hypothetical protein
MKGTISRSMVCCARLDNSADPEAKDTATGLVTDAGRGQGVARPLSENVSTGLAACAEALVLRASPALMKR